MHAWIVVGQCSIHIQVQHATAISHALHTAGIELLRIGYSTEQLLCVKVWGEWGWCCKIVHETVTTVSNWPKSFFTVITHCFETACYILVYTTPFLWNFLTFYLWLYLHQLSANEWPLYPTDFRSTEVIISGVTYCNMSRLCMRMGRGWRYACKYALRSGELWSA